MEVGRQTIVAGSCALLFYRDHIYPHLVSTLGDPRPIREVRQGLIPLTQGKVLEIGVGPGANFLHYDPARVSKVYALEPNSGMIRLATQQRRRTKLDIEFLDLPGERIPLEDGSVDTVVSTFTLCTVPGVVEVIRGIGRVLRPGGKFIFFEHGLSPRSSSTTLAAVVGAHSALGVRRLPRNKGHSVSDHSGRVQD